MLTSFRIKNFRGFRDFTIDGLERVNLIAGENNVGKTALLEALYLHLGPNNPELSFKINTWRGIDRFKIDPEDIFGSLFWDYTIDSTIEITSFDTNRLERRLQITLSDISATQIGEDNGVKYTNTSSQAVTQKQFKLEYQDSDGNTATSAGHLTETGFEGNRGLVSSPLHGAILPTRYFNAEEDAKRFSELAKSRKDQGILKTLQILEPRLKGLSIQEKGGGWMVHGEIGKDRLLPTPLMGSGTTRLLSIVLGIAFSENGFYIVDEIETGLHHSVMEQVWTAIGHAAQQYDVQVFATTHSWECITAAHAAFSARKNYDFRLHRLDRVDDGIEAVTLDQGMLNTAISAGLEVR